MKPKGGILRSFLDTDRGKASPNSRGNGDLLRRFGVVAFVGRLIDSIAVVSEGDDVAGRSTKRRRRDRRSGDSSNRALGQEADNSVTD